MLTSTHLPLPRPSIVPALLAANDTMPAARPTVLLVDGHELMRCGVKSLYAELGGVAVRWLEADTLHEALEIFGREAHIDAVLLDLNLADCKGLQGLRQFVSAFPQARVAVFSTTQDEFIVRQARALGAVGYLPKAAAGEQIRAALTALLWPPDRTEPHHSGPCRVLFPSFPAAAMPARAAGLGQRQLEVLELVLSGCSNQEIGKALRLSLGTVKNHVSSLLLAFDVRSRSHMVSLFR